MSTSTPFRDSFFKIFRSRVAGAARASQPPFPKDFNGIALFSAHAKEDEMSKPDGEKVFYRRPYIGKVLPVTDEQLNAILSILGQTDSGLNGNVKQ